MNTHPPGLRKQRRPRLFVVCAALMATFVCSCDGKGEIPTDPDALVDALYYAVKYEGHTRVEALIEAGAPTHLRDMLGWTPLHYAVNRLHSAEFDDTKLIEAVAGAPGTEVDAEDNSGLAPAFIAARYGSIDVMNILERYGADLRSRDGDGFTLLMTAVRHRRADMVLHLISKGADVNEMLPAGGTALFIAIRGRTPEIVSLLIENGASVNGNGKAEAPIIFAAAMQNVDVVKLLLEAGSNANAFNRKTGLTPLHRAVASGPAMVELLLEAGARPGVSDQKGTTPLDLATELGDTESIKLLTEATRRMGAAAI